MINEINILHSFILYQLQCKLLTVLPATKKYKEIRKQKHK